MISSKNILFILSLLFGVIFFTSEKWDSWVIDSDEQTVLVEDNDDNQPEENLEDKPLFNSCGILSIQTTFKWNKIGQPKDQFVIELKYPIWLPPKISLFS